MMCLGRPSLVGWVGGKHRAQVQLGEHDSRNKAHGGASALETTTSREGHPTPRWWLASSVERPLERVLWAGGVRGTERIDRTLRQDERGGLLSESRSHRGMQDPT